MKKYLYGIKIEDFKVHYTKLEILKETSEIYELEDRILSKEYVEVSLYNLDTSDGYWSYSENRGILTKVLVKHLKKLELSIAETLKKLKED